MLRVATSKQEADKSVAGNKRKIESLKIENLMSKTEKVSSVSKTSVPSIMVLLVSQCGHIHCIHFSCSVQFSGSDFHKDV